MEINEESVQMLLAMGFPHEGEIRRALKMARNDINEALSILTNDSPANTYDTLDDLDVEMKDNQSSGTQVSSMDPMQDNYDPPEYGPQLLCPSYDEVMQKETAMESSNQDGQGLAEAELEPFPVANLIELEGRVFTESWSIPYRKDESLGKCLLAATRLAKEGVAELNEHCKRFLGKCIKESFSKLMTSGAVHRWGPDIQEGVYDMLQILIDLVAIRLQYDPVPVDLLDILAMAFDPATEFHTKNKSRRPDKNYFEEKFGSQDKMYACSPSSTTYKDPYGWLTNLINKFGEKGGMDLIKAKLESDNLDAWSLSAMMCVFGCSAEYLNPKVMQTMLANGMESAVEYVKNLSENDLKHKNVICVCDMLASMKLICMHLWPNGEKRIDNLRLEFVLRLLKSPHFNARMNALKEVTKWIEESSGTKTPKCAISQDQILDWLVDNKVLSITLEGNIDQMQYCEKIKNIVDFLGHRLSVDELTKIWKMQNGETNAVIDNIHSIIGAAGVKFNSQQLEHLVIIVQKSWEIENDKMREKLLSLIGKIGRDTRISKTTTRILELLWDLAHLPALPTHLIEQALEEHLAILSDSFIVKETVKRQYINKCVDDIKEGKWVLPALKQLLQISKNIAKHSFHKAEKGILQELNQRYEIIKQVTNSLKKFHDQAVHIVKENRLSADTLVDGRYTHKDYVVAHLSFLQFVLQEGALYLPWNRARDVWDTLIANQEASEWDRETAFEWFTNGTSDLEAETQSQLFQKELLRLDASTLSNKGFSCFKCFFENVNQHEHRLKKTGASFSVEKLELIGLEYLWDICLNTPDADLAEQAISMLMNVSYINLSSRLKRDPLALHKKFIQECYSRLETLMVTLRGSAIAQALSNATRILTGLIVPEAASSWTTAKSSNYVNIERLLLIAERYITCVEEYHVVPRTIPPHGASFQGQPITLYITCETPKMECTLKAHTNETIGSIRQKIAVKFKSSPEHIQIMANDKMHTKDQKLLHQLYIEDQHVISVRCFSSGSTSSSGSSTYFLTQESLMGTPKKDSFDLEQEKMLPGVVMASGGQVFEMLYQLADLDEASKHALPTSASETGSGSAGASLLAQMQFGHPLAMAPGFLPTPFSSAHFRPGEHSPYNFPALHPSFFRPHLDPATLGSLLNPRGMTSLHHNPHSPDALRDVHPSAFTPAKRMRLHEDGSAHSPRDGCSPRSPRDDMGSRDHDQDRPRSGSSTCTSPGMTPAHRLSYSPASSHRTNGDIIDHHVMNRAEDLRLKLKVEDGDGIRCPICRALLQAEEIRPHLHKEFNSLKEQLQRGTSTQTETCSASCDNSSKSRYDTFLRIRRNREARFGKLRGDRKRQRYSDGLSSMGEHLDVSSTSECMPPSPCRDQLEEETVDVTSFEETEVSVIYHSSPVDSRQSPENRTSTPEQECVPQQSPFHDQRVTQVT